MKKRFISLVLVCAMVLFGAGMSLAGQGKGPGKGPGPVPDVLSGVPFSFKGEVIAFSHGGSLTLATDTDGNVQLFGIGPVNYWESRNVDYPVIGDTLTAKGFAIDCNGVNVNVVMSITVDGTTIDLRDPETGKPLWQVANGGTGGSGSGSGPIPGVLSGVPFTFTGEVIGFAHGGSLVLAATDGNVQISGVGPLYYWESKNAGFPAIGDTLTAQGFTVNYNGVYVNVVMSITIDGTTINLRDPETGKPLWQGGFGGMGSSGRK